MKIGRSSRLRVAWVCALALCVIFSGCTRQSALRTILVRVSTYLDNPSRPADMPVVTAWGEALEPGVKSVAISRDLLELGIGHRTPVQIEGLPGEYLVLDKMPPERRGRVSIYMGSDTEAARRWGVRTVLVSWRRSDVED